MKLKDFNLIKIIITTIVTLLIPSCNDDKNTFYEVKNDEVIYHSVYRKGQEYYTKAHVRTQIVKGADATTFGEISKQYGADAIHVFYKATQLKSRDPLTFKVINKFITTDKFSVYLENKKIDNSDGLSFQFLNGFYAIDNNQVYYFLGTQYEVLKNVDRKTFAPIDNYYDYAKDTNHVYYRNHLINNAKPTSF